MTSNVQVDTSALDTAHRRLLEDLIGRDLKSEDRVTISIESPSAAPVSAKPVQSLSDWTRMYEGLSDAAVEEIDAVIRTRTNLSRDLP